MPEEKSSKKEQKESNAQASASPGDTLSFLKAIYEQNERIKRRLTLMTVGSYIRLAIILVPIILGLIYLPRFLDDASQVYQLLRPPSQNNAGIQKIISNIPEGQFQSILDLISGQ